MEIDINHILAIMIQKMEAATDLRETTKIRMYYRSTFTRLHKIHGISDSDYAFTMKSIDEAYETYKWLYE